MRIRKFEDGHIRIFDVEQFVVKMVEKKVIAKRDKLFYKKNPESLCEMLNRRDRRFGISYSVLKQEF